VLPPRPWPSAPHLPRLLTQALLQVLANAIDAIEPGGTISLAHADLPEHVGVVVDDDGAGIAPEHVARVLEPFFTTKARAPGLGLHAAQSAMREQGGRVEIGARPEGRGARVVLLLPKGGSRAARPAVPTAGTPERR
jgi:signal transduction histidine kinase